MYSLNKSIYYNSSLFIPIRLALYRSPRASLIPNCKVIIYDSLISNYIIFIINFDFIPSIVGIKSIGLNLDIHHKMFKYID